MNLIEIEKLKQFLTEANRETYANKNAPKAASTYSGSEDYHFEKDGLIYHDTYFGARDFIGEEVVYYEKRPVWGANYFGYILDEGVDKKEVYDFLREALIQESDDAIPVRGPKYFSIGDKEYRFDVEGYLDRFSGKEEILFGGIVVYQCLVHGGFIR